MVTLKQIAIGTGIVVGFAGAAYLNDQGTLSEKPNLVYQGHHVDRTDGFNLLIFDDESLEDRTTKIDLRAIGNPKDFERGKKYDVMVRSPRLGGLEKVESIKPSD